MKRKQLVNQNLSFVYTYIVPERGRLGNVLSRHLVFWQRHVVVLVKMIFTLHVASSLLEFTKSWLERIQKVIWHQLSFFGHRSYCNLALLYSTVYCTAYSIWSPMAIEQSLSCSKDLSRRREFVKLVRYLKLSIQYIGNSAIFWEGELAQNHGTGYTRICD